jgi:hypothetical protein
MFPRFGGMEIPLLSWKTLFPVMMARNAVGVEPPTATRRTAPIVRIVRGALEVSPPKSSRSAQLAVRLGRMLAPTLQAAQLDEEPSHVDAVF